MSRFAIAGIQMPISNGDNTQAMLQRIEHVMAIYPWVELVMFSELSVFGPHPEHARALPGDVEKPFQDMAAKHGIWLLPGSLMERAEDHLFNTAPVINPQGEVIRRYRKMYPFYPYEEGVSPGAEFCVFDIENVGRFGVSICYDIWFPETTRALAAQGVEVLLHPVMTTYIDRDIDIVMARAAAAANQCFVIDINGIGAGGLGQSCVFDPAARCLHQAGSHEEIIPVEINLEEVRHQRRQGTRNLGQTLKSFRDSRVTFDIYGEGADMSYLDSLGELVKPPRQR
jgi:predicted amidohydrolase